MERKVDDSQARDEKLVHVRDGDRDGDRLITSVACPCAMHVYAWQTRTWFLKLVDGSVGQILAGEVPHACRASFASTPS